jgi:hypothetical protein
MIEYIVVALLETYNGRDVIPLDSNTLHWYPPVIFIGGGKSNIVD